MPSSGGLGHVQHITILYLPVIMGSCFAYEYGASFSKCFSFYLYFVKVQKLRIFYEKLVLFPSQNIPAWTDWADNVVTTSETLPANLYLFLTCISSSFKNILGKKIALCYTT